MIPLLSQAYTGIRHALGDTEVPAGQIWPDNKLQEHVGRAYTLLYQYLSLHDSKLLRRTAYFNLPAYQTYLTPSQLGITNLGQPKDIWTRTVATELAVTGATPAPTSYYLTLASAAHTITDGTSVLVYGVGGISDDVNDEWGVVAPNTTSLRLMGCTATGAWTSGGTITTSAEPWPASPMQPWRDLTDFTLTPVSDTTDRWAFINGNFRFIAATAKRQLRLIYELSGTAPTAPTASLGVDDCLNFIVEYAAGSAASAKGFANTASEHYLRATGNPAGDAGSGGNGMLGQLVKVAVKAAQKTERTVIPRFRPKRNVGPGNRY